MRTRKFGQSKLTAVVVWDFFTLLLAKFLGRALPAKFPGFVSVGLLGLGVQMLMMALLFRHLGLGYQLSLACSIWVEMTHNYVLNNMLTFRENMLRGLAFFKGMMSFYVSCAFGALINFSVASVLETVLAWWLSTFVGAVAGAVWNYATTSTFTWKT